LGETRVTAWDDRGVPTAATIVLSPDADGHGWFIDPTTDGAAAFGQSLGATASAAQLGSAAYGHYDLLTAILHELGHVEGLMPQNPDFERYVQAIGGSEFFVAPGLSIPLFEVDLELVPGTNPGDVLGATLAPGVRELPSAFDAQILDLARPIPAPPQAVSPPVAGPKVASPTVAGLTVSPVTVVDQAVAALGNPPMAGGPPLALGPIPGATVDGQPPARRKGHPVSVKSRHSGSVHHPRPASHNVITPAHRHGGKPAIQTPNAALALELAHRPRNPFHRPFKP